MKRGLLFVFIFSLLSSFVNGQTETKDDGWYRKFYHIKMGNLRFHANRANFRGITNTMIMSDTIKMYNDWGETMTFEVKNVPEVLTIDAIPETLEPGQEGIIALTYDAVAKGQFGSVYDHFILLTNDTLMPEKRIICAPNIQEDFSTWTEEQMANAPKIAFENENYDFGTVDPDTKVTHSFVFANDGQSDLIIRKSKSSCGCTATTPEKTTLKPGESSKIDIVFNTKNRKGKQHKTVTVIANDPEKSKTILHINGVIKEPEQ